MPLHLQVRLQNPLLYRFYTLNRVKNLCDGCYHIQILAPIVSVERHLVIATFKEMLISISLFHIQMNQEDDQIEEEDQEETKKEEEENEKGEEQITGLVEEELSEGEKRRVFQENVKTTMGNDFSDSISSLQQNTLKILLSSLLVFIQAQPKNRCWWLVDLSQLFVFP